LVPENPTGGQGSIAGCEGEETAAGIHIVFNLAVKLTLTVP
jgi:hypothetical protein